MSYMETAKKLFWELFINREDCYALQNPDGSYVKIDKPIDDDLIVKHLYGTSGVTLGCYQIDRKNLLKWICLDIDVQKDRISPLLRSGRSIDEITKEYSPALKEQVTRIKQALEHFNIPSYVEYSGFKGYHVWAFLSEKMNARKVKMALEEIMSSLYEEIIDCLSVEVFPKQYEIKPGEYGSLVKAPLGINRRSNRRSLFVDIDNDFEPYGDGKTFFKAQIDFLSQVEKVNPDCILDIIDVVERTPPCESTTCGVFNQKFEFASKPVDEIYRNCEWLRSFRDRIENTGECSEQERFAIASIFINVPGGQEEVHRLLSHWHRYRQEITQAKLNNMIEKGIRPVTCRYLCGCENIRQRRGVSPVAFAYVKKQK